MLALDQKAQDQVLVEATREIKVADGVKKIIAKLDKIYKNDRIDSAYEAFEKGNKF